MMRMFSGLMSRWKMPFRCCTSKGQQAIDMSTSGGHRHQVVAQHEGRRVLAAEPRYAGIMDRSQPMGLRS
jgi:hypothetical protein